MALLDWARMVLAIGVTIYAALVARQFRGGKLSESYLILVICGLVGACAAASDALNYEMAHGLLGIIFYALLFVAL